MYQSNWKRFKADNASKEKKPYLGKKNIAEKPQAISSNKLNALPSLSSLGKTAVEPLYNPRTFKSDLIASKPKKDRSAATKSKAVVEEVAPGSVIPKSWLKNKYDIAVPYILEPVVLQCSYIQSTSGAYVLGRVLVGTTGGIVIYDKKVKPVGGVSNYMTNSTGLTKSSFSGAVEFKQCLKEVDSVIQDRVIIGYDLGSQFKALMASHTSFLLRDLKTYARFQGASSLREAYVEHTKLSLDENYSAMEEYRWCVALYNAVRLDWEKLCQVQFGHKLAQHSKLVMKKAMKEDHKLQVLQTLEEGRKKKREQLELSKKRARSDSDDSDSEDSDSDSDSEDSSSEDEE